MSEKRIKIILETEKAEANAKSLNASMINIGANADKINVSMRTTNQEINKTYDRSKQITQNVTKITNNYRQLASSTAQISINLRQANESFAGINSALTAIAAAVASALSVQRVVEYSDAFTSVQNQLRQTVTSQDALEESTARIIKISIDSRANLEATSKLYTRMRLAIDEAKFSSDDLYQVTETINKGLALSGATTAEAAGALLQFSQAMASGVLRGEEFNSVSEQAPVILKAVQIELGKTQGELRAMAAEGQLSAEVVIRAIKNYSDVVDRQFSKSTRTFGQSLELARTQSIEFVGSSALIGQAIKTAGDAIVGISSNLETLQNVIAGLAIIYGSKFAGSIAMATGAFIANQAAATRATVTYSAMGLVIDKTTVSMNIATAATTALNRAVAFLGGPVGVILVAAASIGFFNSRLEEIKAAEAAAEIDKLISKYKELDEVGRKIEINKLERERDELASRRFLVQAELDAAKAKPQSTSGFLATGGTDGLKQNIKTSALNAELLQIETRLNEIGNLSSKLFSSTLPKISGREPAKAAAAPELSKKELAAQKRIPDLEADLEQYFAKIEQRSDSLVQGILDENNIIEASLNSRVALFGKYGVAQYDQTLTQYQKELAALEFRLSSESEAIEMAYVKNSAQLREQRQRIDEDEKITVEAKAEADKLLTEQLLLQEQVKQQALYELQKEGISLRQQAAIDETQRTLDMQRQIQNTYLSTAQVGIGALTNLIGGSKKAGKALRLIQAGISAFQVYANHQAAAAQVLATPPGPVLNPTLIPLAASISLAGKVSAAAIMAGAAAETFSGGGGGGGLNISGGGGSPSATAPQLPQAPEQVQSLTDIGYESFRRELEEYASSDGVIPARIMLRYLNSEQAARRIGS